jgi:hypothetical protein
MFIVGMISWWYTLGWRRLAVTIAEKLSATEDYFSIDILLGSLFAPYKQISASGSSIGTFQDKLRDWSDKQFSRVFGAIIRLFLIVLGLAWMAIQALVGGVLLVLWPLAPVAPLIGLLLMVTVGSPWIR